MKNNLKKSREDIKMSQDELAKKIGISREYLSQLEKGKRNPSLQLAFKIAYEFNVKVEDIFENTCNYNQYEKYNNR